MNGYKGHQAPTTIHAYTADIRKALDAIERMDEEHDVADYGETFTVLEAAAAALTGYAVKGLLNSGTMTPMAARRLCEEMHNTGTPRSAMDGFYSGVDKTRMATS